MIIPVRIHPRGFFNHLALNIHSLQVISLISMLL
jgi:hypothetical protein